jgi:hypothetical protein
MVLAASATTKTILKFAFKALVLMAAMLTRARLGPGTLGSSATSLGRDEKRPRTKVPNCDGPRQAIVKKGLTVPPSRGH